MKSVFRLLALGILTTTFAAAGFAQTASDACADITAKQATYKTFTDNYSSKTVEGLQTALSAAKEYIEKYGSCADDKQQIDYFKGYIPPAEKNIADINAKKKKDDLYARFNNAQSSKNWDEFYAAGKEIIAAEPDSETALDIMIAFGSIGLDQSAAGNMKYNADTIKYAQMAIDKINAGKTTKNFGVPGKTVDTNFAYKLVNDKDKSTKVAESKANTLSWLNYNIGYLKYYVDKSETAKKEAIPYFYKVTQYDAAPKKYPQVYYAIGLNYYSELDRLDTDRLAKLKAAGNKDTDETKAIFAMEKGYADRVLDAYSRVYNLVPSDPKSKALKDSTYADLKSVYALRYQGKGTTTLDSLIASTSSKPLVDPSTAVTPVVDAEPTPATTGTTGMTGTAMSANPAAATTVKPAATTTTVKPTTTTVKTTVVPTKPVAKKPAPKR